MTFIGDFPEPPPLRRAIEAACRADETACLDAVLAEAAFDDAARGRIAATARRLVEGMRGGTRVGTLDAFMHEYELSNQEGVVLMCLAEALLRIPDAGTADRLIRDKIGEADWARHLGHSGSVLVNAGTWALMLTGRVVRMEDAVLTDLPSFLGRLVARSGEPVIRRALTQAMRILGRQFVMGRTIEEALERAAGEETQGYCHSFDMLGEAACTAADAERYAHAYAHAIDVLGREAAGAEPGALEISVKLSALHPRFEYAQRRRILSELVPRVVALAARAREAGVALCVDAEEAHLLELSLDVIEAVLNDPAVAGWDGFGAAVQAYQKRAPAVLDWLADLGRRQGRRLRLRLVKGAYWDSEIKHAQEQGLDSYPVFTRKASTDVSYLACARRIVTSDVFFGQFATHNAHTFAAVMELAGDRRDLEFQRLHGMGHALYDQVMADDGWAVPCRVYAPVGSHEDLLAYLVRRLLENGANTSFVNRIVDEAAPLDDVVADPATRVAGLAHKPHPRIPLPADLLGPERRNSLGVDLSDPGALRPLARAMGDSVPADGWTAAPLIAGKAPPGTTRPVLDPADHRRQVGAVTDAGPAEVEAALATAADAAPAWDATPAAERAACLSRAADLMEADMPELMALAVREAGKTIDDAVAEVREAVDFCRYYGAGAGAEFAAPEPLPGPTGESNQVALRGRGVFACISPWNFPLAIFTGQVTAALAAGNAVIAKPAEQTPLMAARAVTLLHRAGVPEDALHLLPGGGPEVGAPLVADPRVSGVAFTGSVETAHTINRALAARPGPIVPLIAETGGQNALIVDSTALPEQVVADTITSAFRSAGQRCSALRVLFVQADIAPRITDMLAGAVAELTMGDPARLDTDVGPVIDADAMAMLEAHAARMARDGRLIAQADLPAACAHGTFFAPRAFAIDGIGALEREVFGPILHVVTWAGDRLDDVIAAVNGTGYGLTLGVHSRLDGTVEAVRRACRVGNTYVNRTIIGAVVGVQPFGGEGLSGTGPKAGGPRYLHRFATERTLTVNTAAAGGNAALLSLTEDDADAAPAPSRPS